VLYIYASPAVLMDRHLRQDKQEKEDREEEGKILGTGHMRPLASAGRA